MFDVFRPERTHSAVDSNGPRIEIDELSGELRVLGVDLSDAGPTQRDGSGGRQAFSVDEMAQELAVTFPSLIKFRSSDLAQAFTGPEGIWTGPDDAHRMQDGMAIFNAVDGDLPPYQAGTHGAFKAWLGNRGWQCQKFGEQSFFLSPNPEACVPAGPDAAR